jgi:hypothetical protein
MGHETRSLDQICARKHPHALYALMRAFTRLYHPSALPHRNHHVGKPPYRTLSWGISLAQPSGAWSLVTQWTA